MAHKKNKPPADEPLELPAANPMPHEANPGGVEGADSAWSGGSSNLGEVLNPEPRGSDTTYSTKDLPPDAPRSESVRAFVCDECGQRFETEANLNIHRRTAHRPR